MSTNLNYVAMRYLTLNGVRLSPGQRIPPDWSPKICERLERYRYVRRETSSCGAPPPPLPRTEVRPAPPPEWSTDSFPNLRPYFTHAEWHEREFCPGVAIGNDYSDCPDTPVFRAFRNFTFWAQEEVAILYSLAKKTPGYWLDIGGMSGWTAAHLAAAGCFVASVDPIYCESFFRERAVENLANCGVFQQVGLWADRSEDLFSRSTYLWDGIVVDGDPTDPHPLRDAQAAASRVKPQGVIVLGRTELNSSMRAACQWLSTQKWRVERLRTAHGIAVCHRHHQSIV